MLAGAQILFLIFFGRDFFGAVEMRQPVAIEPVERADLPDPVAALLLFLGEGLLLHGRRDDRLSCFFITILSPCPLPLLAWSSRLEAFHSGRFPGLLADLPVRSVCR